MNEFKELFDRDAYRTEWNTVVLECTPIPSGYGLVLKETCMYPKRGGQLCDRGLLNDVPVQAVFDRDGKIVHETQVAIQPGTPVHGVLDWPVRFDHMQQHSGEHVVSGLVHRSFGYENVGFHMSEESVTLDFSGPLSMEDCRRIEQEANAVLMEDREIEISYPSEVERLNMTYRSKLELSGTVRIVTIPGVDVCACCGTHVKRLGEIGSVLLLSCVKHKKGSRVTMLAGKRAAAYTRRVMDQVLEVSHLLSAEPLKIAESVARCSEQQVLLKQQLNRAQERVLMQKVKDHVPFLLVFEENVDVNVVRRFEEECVGGHGVGLCAVFIADGGKYRYVLRSDTVDLSLLCKMFHAVFDGRGGGPKDLVQGTVFATEEQIRRWFEENRICSNE